MFNEWIIHTETAQNQSTQTLSCVGKRIVTILELQHDKKFTTSVNHTVNLIRKWLDTRGLNGLNEWKLLSNWVVRRVLGTNSENPTPPVKVRRHVWHLIHCAKRSDTYRLAVLSVMVIHRLIRVEPTTDIDSITGAWTGDLKSLPQLIYDLRKVCKTFKQRLRCTTLEPYNFKWTLSGSSGPNCQYARDGLRGDLRAIAKDKGVLSSLLIWSWAFPLQDKWEHIWNLRTWYKKLPTEYADFVKHLRRTGMINTHADLASLPNQVRFLDYFLRPEKLWHSRINFLRDVGGKTRPVASADMLTQSLLRPVHKHITKTLRRVFGDYTFDQKAAISKVKSWTLNSKELISSLDMKSCTDRLPVLFQALVLYFCGILDSKQTLAWFIVMSRRRFMIRTPRFPRGYKIRYRVGQPMGLYSSWPAMALTNNIMVWVSYYRTHGSMPKWRNPSEAPYAIVGDDVVIKGDRLADEYLKILNTLGVEVQKTKSFVDKHICEFAKGWYLNGIDLRPLSPNLLRPRTDYLPEALVALGELLSSKVYYHPRKELSRQLSSVITSQSERNQLLVALSCGFAASHARRDIFRFFPEGSKYLFGYETFDTLEHAVAVWEAERDINRLRKGELLSSFMFPYVPAFSVDQRKPCWPSQQFHDDRNDFYRQAKFLSYRLLHNRRRQTDPVIEPEFLTEDVRYRPSKIVHAGHNWVAYDPCLGHWVWTKPLWPGEFGRIKPHEERNRHLRAASSLSKKYVGFLEDYATKVTSTSKEIGFFRSLPAFRYLFGKRDEPSFWKLLYPFSNLRNRFRVK